MSGQALMLGGALWMGTASICICEQNILKVVGFEDAQVPQTRPGIIVQVYNWASVAPQTLTAAENEAARIFREAGAAVSWLNCPLTIPEAQANPICIDSGPLRSIAVRIIPGVPTNRAITCLGVAFSEGGIYSTIFYPRVHEYAEQRIATHSQILGHAMVHEIGHLLLGPVPHTRFGIMRGGWAAEDLRSMAMGALLFSPQQSVLIRQAATQRIRGQKSAARDETFGRFKFVRDYR